ncbi:MAG TPA: DUF2167 domain-containing protein [Candidatus Sulfotelmatobacter sp.]|nr:DUF2167 domain-containing protein [Candidatus Sulfotelmatobacter sp.]
MKVQYFNAPNGIRKTVGFCLIGVLTGAALVQQSLAQAPSSQSQSLVFSDPLKQINWISGPQTVGDGDIADVAIPDGYRFANASGARVILENTSAPVPNDLAGVLANNAATWYAIFEFAPNGYVSSDSLANIDSSAILAAVKKQLQDDGRGMTSLKWESKPVFDPQTHTLSWSLQVQSASGKSLNEGVALLGRNGVLEVTAVRAYPLGNAPSLAELVSKNVSFKEGGRYSDHQKGDKVGDIALASLIAGDNGESRPSTAGTAAWVYWIYSGFALCAAFGGVMLLVMRKKSRRRVRRHVSAPAATAAAPAPVSEATAPATTVAAVAAAEPSVALANGKLNGDVQSKTGTARANGTNGTRHLHRNRRKKVFDYPKFYTNVMRELSFHAYEASPLVNGKGRNGYTNGHTNGANGHTNGADGSNGTNGSGLNDSVKSGIEELIATQKALIQEQKCLLEQQTRLIEEKRWLIEEQTAFLKGQAGMMSDGQPLKFE